MVSYKTSAASILAAAAMASAQNVTLAASNGTAVSGVDVSIDINFTVVLPFLGPTGIYDVPYVISQHCPGGCTQPTATNEVPYGFVATTTICTVCEAEPTEVTVYSCPNATPTAAVATVCNTCHTDVVVYTPVPTCETCATPACTTVTNVYTPTAVVTPLTAAEMTVYSCTDSTPITTTLCPGCPATVITPTVITPAAATTPVLLTTTLCPGCPLVTVTSVPVVPATIASSSPLGATTTLCPGCPVVSVASVSSAAMVPATPIVTPATTLCPGCPKTLVPSASSYKNTTTAVPTPAVYTGAGNKNTMAVMGLVVAGFAAAALL